MPLFDHKMKTSFEGGGLVLFNDVPSAMQAEKALKEADYTVKLVAPPPAMRKGCDLALEINLVEQPGIERIFKQKAITYNNIVPLEVNSAELLEIIKVTDFGDWIMVKAANMKLTFDKRKGTIVNTSGGGCPDIPYLHIELMDKPLDEAPKPKDIGFTLCALMMDRALTECLAMRSRGEQP